MFIALNNNGDRIPADKAIKEQTYFCPLCGGTAKLKKGQVYAAHFAHETLEECDTFTADMSEWHRKWQEFFSVKNREVPLTLKIDELEYFTEAQKYGFLDPQWDGIENQSTWCTKLLSLETLKKEGKLKQYELKHRADVLACGYVVEFQHSPISSREFNERNWFYKKKGYNVIWIFDFTEHYYKKRITTNRQCLYSWKWPSRIMKNVIPQEELQKEKRIILFFQLFDFMKTKNNQYLRKIVWAPDGCDDNGEHVSSYHRFWIDSNGPKNAYELIKAIKQKAL